MVTDDGTFVTALGGYIPVVGVIRFNNGIAYTVRETGCCLAAAVRQGEGGNTVHKGHISVGAADRRIFQRYGEAEFLRSATSITIDRLRYGQIAVGVAGVRKRCYRRRVLINRSGIAVRIAVFIPIRTVVRFRYGIACAVGQSFNGLAFAALEGDGCFAIGEDHAAVGAAERGIQLDREREILRTVGVVTGKRLADRQTAFRVFVDDS